jgi:hypothetical protein
VDKSSQEGSHAYGLSKFKSKWLGDLYDRIYFNYSEKKEGNQEKRDNLKKYRKIWKRLPAPIVKIIGPKICSQLGV